MKPIKYKEYPTSGGSDPQWLDRFCTAIASCFGYMIVGCTTTFQQTTASFAILNRIKSLRPDIVTVLGGANCEGEMAEGLLSLDLKVDYVFSGESEETFPHFVRSVVALGASRIQNHPRPSLY